MGAQVICSKTSVVPWVNMADFKWQISGGPVPAMLMLMEWKSGNPERSPSKSDFSVLMVCSSRDVNEWEMLNAACRPLFREQTAWVKSYFHFFLLTNVWKSHLWNSTFWWMLWKVGPPVLWAALTFHALRLLGTLRRQPGPAQWNKRAYI